MTVAQSIKLQELLMPFVKEEKKARELVSAFDEIINEQFHSEKEQLVSKENLSETKADIKEEIANLRTELKIEIRESKTETLKTIYIVGLVQFLAIVGSVLAIINFMLK